jgi:virulence-associated protein VapD
MNWISSTLRSILSRKQTTRKPQHQIVSNGKKSTESPRKTRTSIRDMENHMSMIVINPQSTTDLQEITKALKKHKSIPIYSDDDAPKHNSYENIQTSIQSLIKDSKTLCKGINNDYISELFDDADAVFVVGSYETQGMILPSGKIYGFALINFNELRKELYIEMFCTHSGMKYVGEHMIKQMTKISEIVEFDAIRLKSVASAISFYEKYGFEKTVESCEDMCVMVKLVGPSVEIPITPRKSKSRKSQSPQNKRRTKKRV